MKFYSLTGVAGSEALDNLWQPWTGNCKFLSTLDKKIAPEKINCDSAMLLHCQSSKPKHLEIRCFSKSLNKFIAFLVYKFGCTTFLVVCLRS